LRRDECLSNENNLKAETEHALEKKMIAVSIPSSIFSVFFKTKKKRKRLVAKIPLAFQAQRERERERGVYTLEREEKKSLVRT